MPPPFLCPPPWHPLRRREIALVRPAPTDGHADAGAADIASGLAALAQLLPAGSALRKCLEGGRGSYHPV